jgi:hypothetical protein
MKRVNLIFALIVFAAFAIIVTACKKDTNIDLEDTSISQDDAYAEKTFEDISDMADEAYEIGSGNHLKAFPEGRMFLSECATVTLDTTVFPRVTDHRFRGRKLFVPRRQIPERPDHHYLQWSLSPGRNRYYT